MIEKIRGALDKPFRFMEVCGTHTVAIFQSGLHTLLPEDIIHVSGPGCPVCVTHDSEVAAFLDLAAMKNVIVATFGDLMRVPGPKGASLKTAKAEGARVEVVYSPHESLNIAAANKDATVVFLGVGFETTAPTIAATVKMAKAQGIKNFCAISFHKLVPPALAALIADPEAAVDGFLLPGHVSAVIGLEPYRFIAERYNTPAVIAGFEPLDIIEALYRLVEMRAQGKPEVLNAYRRVVADEGNAKARAIMYEVFEPCDALWRGIGSIPGSGLKFTKEYEAFDAIKVLGLTMKDVKPLPGCRCGDVLKGKLRPDQCPLFKKACTPATPVGPCMVSTEGSCAAYYKYRLEG
jgi:hydrogenase expression/formation protein HypD